MKGSYSRFFAYGKNPFILLFACFLVMSLSVLLKEERAASEWSSVYMLVVFIIAAIVLVALIKPMFRKSQELVSAK